MLTPTQRKRINNRFNENARYEVVIEDRRDRLPRHRTVEEQEYDQTMRDPKEFIEEYRQFLRVENLLAKEQLELPKFDRNGIIYANMSQNRILSNDNTPDKFFIDDGCLFDSPDNRDIFDQILEGDHLIDPPPWTKPFPEATYQKLIAASKFKAAALLKRDYQNKKDRDYTNSVNWRLSITPLQAVSTGSQTGDVSSKFMNFYTTTSSFIPKSEAPQFTQLDRIIFEQCHRLAWGDIKAVQLRTGDPLPGIERPEDIMIYARCSLKEAKELLACYKIIGNSFLLQKRFNKVIAKRQRNMNPTDVKISTWLETDVKFKRLEKFLPSFAKKYKSLSRMQLRSEEHTIPVDKFNELFPNSVFSLKFLADEIKLAEAGRYTHRYSSPPVGKQDSNKLPSYSAWINPEKMAIDSERDKQTGEQVVYRKDQFMKYKTYNVPDMSTGELNEDYLSYDYQPWFSYDKTIYTDEHGELLVKEGTPESQLEVFTPEYEDESTYDIQLSDRDAFGYWFEKMIPSFPHLHTKNDHFFAAIDTLKRLTTHRQMRELKAAAIDKHHGWTRSQGEFFKQAFQARMMQLADVKERYTKIS